MGDEESTVREGTQWARKANLLLLMLLATSHSLVEEPPALSDLICYLTRSVLFQAMQQEIASLHSEIRRQGEDGRHGTRAGVGKGKGCGIPCLGKQD